MASTDQEYSFVGGLTTKHTYAVIGSARKFKQHKHAWKVWQALKRFGCVVYPVASGLSRLEGTKVYQDLVSLPEKVDVVVPCLLPEEIPDLITSVKKCGCTYIWFQEQTWNKEFQAQCDIEGIQTIKSCVLLHQYYRKPFCYLNPCYWHGLHEPKVPFKRNRMWKR